VAPWHTERIYNGAWSDIWNGLYAVCHVLGAPSKVAVDSEARQKEQLNCFAKKGSQPKAIRLNSTAPSAGLLKRLNQPIKKLRRVA
jgi:hypothetical protein